MHPLGIPVVPLVAMFLIVFFGKRLPAQGWELAVGAMGFVAVYGIALLALNWADPMAFEDQIEMGVIGGGLVLEWGWVVVTQ